MSSTHPNNAPATQRVVGNEKSTYSDTMRGLPINLGIALFIDVIEDQIEISRDAREGLQSIANTDFNAITDSGAFEVARGVFGIRFTAVRIQDVSALGYSSRQPDCGVSNCGAEFGDALGLDGPGKLRQERPHHRSDDRNVFALRAILHFREDVITFGNQTSDVLIYVLSGDHYFYGKAKT